jgi:biopolymer transport protein ExbD
MRRYGKRATARFETGPNMTPLVDVVMVILIFLMLVGTFVTEKFLAQRTSLTQVASSASAAVEPGTVPDEPIIIRLDMATSDRFLARIDRFSTSNPADVSQHLAGLLSSMESIGRTRDKLTVVIQPTGAVKYRFLIEVYEAALSAGFEKVSFATPG